MRSGSTSWSRRSGGIGQLAVRPPDGVEAVIHWIIGGRLTVRPPGIVTIVIPTILGSGGTPLPFFMYECDKNRSQ